MKLRKLFVILAAAILPVLLTFSAFAQTPGSLVILNVRKPAVLYRVADPQGVPASPFGSVLETNVTGNNLSPELAKTLYAYAKTNSVAGQTAAPDAQSKITYAPLEEGYYLVCSTAQQGEFAPFFISIPMNIGGKTVYDIQAEPKTGTPDDPNSPTAPSPSNPNIPQTGYILWPQYLLLSLGGIAIVAGTAEILKGREKRHE